MATGKRMVIAACGFMWVLSGLAGAFLTGCDLPPAPPTTADARKVQSVLVDLNDPEEVTAVRGLLDAAVQYEHSLKVLRSYYRKTGAYDQQTWAERELANFVNAQTWQYEGIERPAPRGGESIEIGREASLVEQVVSARESWKDRLARLAELYKSTGMDFKLSLIRSAQRRFDPIRTYRYFLHAEIPPATLRPIQVIPEADALFDKAYKIHRSGKPLPAITDYNKQREALLLFLQLVEKYPACTKIAHAAYYIGEIYKEYFNENIRAVHWYERAWQWDANINLPARFQAAVVYDLRLAHYGKAVALYREVIKHEQFNRSNVSFATQRIKELTGQKP